MENDLIKQRIEDIWNTIKASKGGEIQRHLETSRERATQIIGSNQIQKIRHSSVLKLLVYEMIVFADQATNSPTAQKGTSRSADSSRGERGAQGTGRGRSGERLAEIKELVCEMSQLRGGELVVQVSQLKTLLQRVKGLERELQREEEERRRASFNSSDSEGTELMIQQLQEIIRRKQNRIKELNVQLQENFHDKQLLQEEIDHLESTNYDLDARVRELEGRLAQTETRKVQLDTFSTQIDSRSSQLEARIKLLEGQLAQVNEEFDRYKQKEKEELLFGTSSNHNELPKPQQQQQSIENIEPPSPSVEAITNSTKLLYQYFQPQQQIKPGEEKTIKKKPMKIIESDEQQDLLLTVQPPSPERTIYNADHCLQRMLLMQALFIEKALEDMAK